MTTKKELRITIKSLKNQQDRKEWEEFSNKIFAQVEQTEAFKKSSTILSYWSMNDEVITHQAVERWSKHKKSIPPTN